MDSSSNFQVDPLLRAWIEVDLDALTHNVNCIRKSCVNKNIGVVAMVKAGAYGHGSVPVSLHLKSIGVERLGVATIDEALHLKRNGVPGPIHIFGNGTPREVRSSLEEGFIPTLCQKETLSEVATLSRDVLEKSCVTIKVDSGMSRNGCQPEELDNLVEHCKQIGVRIDGFVTHFAVSYGQKTFTDQQLEVFKSTCGKYRSDKVFMHCANSGAVVRGVATDLDFVRTGIVLYGLSPGRPTLVKKLPAGRSIGYGLLYKTTEEEWIGTIPIGYADGYWRCLSGNPEGLVRRDKTGELCPIVGRISMDAVTVKFPCRPDDDEVFTFVTPDYDSMTSASGIGDRVGSISYEVATRMSIRLRRLYLKSGKVVQDVPPLSPLSF